MSLGLCGAADAQLEYLSSLSSQDKEEAKWLRWEEEDCKLLEWLATTRPLSLQRFFREPSEIEQLEEVKMEVGVMFFPVNICLSLFPFRAHS